MGERAVDLVCGDSSYAPVTVSTIDMLHVTKQLVVRATCSLKSIGKFNPTALFSDFSLSRLY